MCLREFTGLGEGGEEQLTSGAIRIHTTFMDYVHYHTVTSKITVANIIIIEKFEILQKL